MDQLVASLRALAISRKTPTTLDDILLDYVEFEGRPIEATKYGFRTIEDLLTASGEFKITKKQGETYLIPKPNKVTEHISKMVKKQKSVVKKRNSKVVYSTSVHLAPSMARRKGRKRSLESPITISSSSDHTSSIEIGPQSPPEFLESKHVIKNSASTVNYNRSSPVVNYSPPNQKPQMLPGSSFGNFRQNFPEPINNYNDLEIAVALEVWAVFSGTPPPVYNVYRNPGCNGFYCAVFVDNVCCSTDPAFYDTPLQAKIEAAYLALQIIHNTHQLRLYPVFKGSPQKLMRKLFEGLKHHPGGIPCQIIPKMYRETYGETLPKNWLQWVKMSRLFMMRTAMSGDVLVVANWY